MKPLRPLAPIFASVAIVVGWWAVAHNGGQGWVQALGDLVFATLAVGVVGPAAHLAGGQPEILTSPSDGQAGAAVEMTVRSRRRLRVRPIDPAGAEQYVGPSAGRRSESPMVLLPRHRGVYRSVRVEIASAAPFGLQWWGRKVTLELPAPLHVAPRPGRPLPVSAGDENAGEDAPPDRTGTTGEFRGVRRYVPGDQRRQVHWPASAHTGQMMVRDLEPPSGEPVHLAVVLPEDPDEAEEMAGRAFATVVALLDAGRPTILDTLEEEGPVSGPVAGHRAAGRRLAASRPRSVTAALPAPAAAGPEP